MTHQTLVERLRPYLQHDRTCKAYLYPGFGMCGCGLAELLEQVRALTGQEGAAPPDGFRQVGTVVYQRDEAGDIDVRYEREEAAPSPRAEGSTTELIAALRWQAEENGCYCETDISAEEAGIPISERCPYCLMGKAAVELESALSALQPTCQHECTINDDRCRKCGHDFFAKSKAGHEGAGEDAPQPPEWRDIATAPKDGTPDYKALYFDLLYQVARKHPGESRHDTAKRYITRAEQPSGEGPKCAAPRPSTGESR